MSQSMSITRALATLKTLDTKIERASGNLTAVALQKGQGSATVVVGSQATPEQFAGKVKDDYKSILDMIAMRNALKKAIVTANATTKVTVGKVEMTIAEAVERKRSIVLESQLLTHLRRQLTAGTNLFDKEQTAYTAKLERVRSEFSNSREKKLSEDDLALIVRPIEMKEQPQLLDPLQLATLTENLYNEIDDFLLNVDFALSEINAKTEITVG